MAVRTDPEGNETTSLFALADLDGAAVLEIGCGDGRLTWRYADRTAHVTAIDPFADGIARAKRRLPERLRGTIDFRQVAFEDFAAASDPDIFDIAILSWSLCWMESKGMVHALEEIHRLLRRTGTLMEIHPVHGAWVEVRSGADVAFVESDPGFDSDDDLLPTEKALSGIVRRGRFVIDRSQEFDFLTYASSVRALREYFAMVGGYDQGPSASVTRLRDRLYGRAGEVLGRAKDAQLVYREQARISRLIPVVATGSGRRADG